MRNVKSYVVNSTDFIRKLDALTPPPNCTLATLDVASLYMSHEDMLDAVRIALEKVSPPHLPPIDVVLLLLTYVLKNYIFSFNSECYHQKYSVAMATKLAPVLATIFMAQLHVHVEESYMYLNNTPFPPKKYLRYIHDLFMTWMHGEKALYIFVQGLNNLKPRIKFTLESSTTSITFLDLRIFKGPRFASCRKLDTEIHYKTTNNFTHVHGSSHHPPTCTKR